MHACMRERPRVWCTAACARAVPSGGRGAGIMGDEMGLGKTIQLICFLGGLHFSGKHRPALIVAPVTTLQHWLRELHTWYPRFRVIKLHNSSMRLGALLAW